MLGFFSSPLHCSGPISGVISNKLTPRLTVMLFGIFTSMGIILGSLTRHLNMFVLSMLLSGKPSWQNYIRHDNMTTILFKCDEYGRPMIVMIVY